MATLKGRMVSADTYLYPDDDLDSLPQQFHLATPRNGLPGFQVVVASEDSAQMQIDDPHFAAEIYRLRAIPVEYNTGDGKEQGGAMVLQDRPAVRPAYATRLAPFHVYDCLEPAPSGQIKPDSGRCGWYVCFAPKAGLEPGIYSVPLRIVTTEAAHEMTINITVYDVLIPESDFDVTNWFSLDAISRCHDVAFGTPAYYTVLRRYADAMKRARQTCFYLGIDDHCIATRDPMTFDFTYLQPLIEVFRAAGLGTLEIGPLLSRGFRPDGSPDMYTDTFRCAADPAMPFESIEGYALTSRFLQALAAFLRDIGLDQDVIFHIHDEPDIHVPDEACLANRRRQYYQAVCMLKKHLPKARVIEAVGSATFLGGIDIWVPGTPAYEAKQEIFDELRKTGDAVWTYVCCGPEGFWLNRFLDKPVIQSRLLFWGCAAYRLAGYLHWGFNQFPEGMDPYVATACYNPTGIGTSFPCGDAFMVYPGQDGPSLSLRLEAQRRGAEDVAMLQSFLKRDPQACDQLIAEIFTNNYTYNDDPDHFAAIYERMLASIDSSTSRE